MTGGRHSGDDWSSGEMKRGSGGGGGVSGEEGASSRLIDTVRVISAFLHGVALDVSFRSWR